jgi:lysyl-tRNA synthetase class 1
MPNIELTDAQKLFIRNLSKRITDAPTVDGPAMHQLIYDAKADVDLKPAEAFQALYRVILGQDSGPKAGWFLASLDRAWLVKRLALEA